MDERSASRAILARGLIGREVTRVLIDAAVTLQFANPHSATAEVTLASPFRVVDSTPLEITITPGELGENASQVVRLFRQPIVDAAIAPDNELELRFADGSLLYATADDRFESWSFVSGDGSRVICLPGGGLAYWSPAEPA